MAIEGLWQQSRPARASDVGEGSTVGRPTLATPRAARAARSEPGPTPTPRNVTPAAVVLALHLRRDAARIGPGLDGWRAADGTSSVVVAPALRGHVLDVRLRVRGLAALVGAPGTLRLRPPSGLLRQEPPHERQHHRGPHRGCGPRGVVGPARAPGSRPRQGPPQARAGRAGAR